jgi:fructuronate reductase
VLRTVLGEGRSMDPGLLILAAWVAHLRGGEEIRDVRAAELRAATDGTLTDAVPRLLTILEPGLVDVPGLAARVVELAADLT